MDSLEPEHKVRSYFDNWKFWMVLAYLALAGYALLLYYNYERTADAVRVETLRQAREAAAADAEVERCKDNIPQVRAISDFVTGVGLFADAAIENSKAILAITPVGSEQYATRKTALDNLMDTRDAMNINFPVPTKKQCEARRNQPIPQGESNNR